MAVLTSYIIVFVVFFAILGGIIYFLDPILRRLIYSRVNNNYINCQDTN